MNLFFLILGAYLGGNFYIYVRGMQAIRHFPLVVKVAFGLFLWASALSLIPVVMMRNARCAASAWAHLLFEYSTGWLVFTLYMALFLLCFDVFRLFNHSFRYGFVCALTLTVGVLSYGFYHYQHPSVRTLDLTVNKPVAGAGDTFRVVAVSDIHLGMGTTRGQLQKYIRMINAQHPDLILIGGDLIDNSLVPAREMLPLLSQLKAQSGIYMAPGNHEYISGIAECVASLRETPVCLLRDSVVTLPNGIQIVGRDDRSNPSRLPFTQLANRLNPAWPVLVADHQPVDLMPVVDANADLLFCGHTHDGQVWPLNLLTGALFDISYGYEQRDNTHIYVSSGLALWGPPFRIGTRSEMIVFNLSFRRP
jgi:predicted MPP superfamily phosphohydrolase